MQFVILGKFREKVTKAAVMGSNKYMAKIAKEGIKFSAMYATLGRYDIIGIFEAPDERTAMKAMIGVGDIISTETLVAVPGEEVINLVK